ncbi:MAG: hypothetical protein JWM21_942 [Acidobacteria bacterium]|nr:hypothetical protein [Acidobacteriota bacterium]
MKASNRIFKALVEALGLLGLMAAAVENFRHFHSAIEEYYWYVLAVAYILSTAAAWPQSSSTTVPGRQDTYRIPLVRFLLKYIWIILISIAFLAVGLYRYRLIHIPESGDRPVIKPGDVRRQPSRFDEWPLGTAYAQSQAAKPRLLQFNLVPEKTSYIRTDTQYDLPRKTVSRVVLGECDPNFDPEPALKSLRDYAKTSGKESLLKFLGSADQLKKLIKEHPGRARELMPTKAELSKMNQSDYTAIMSWMRNCVGILFPVFAVVIENPFDQDLMVTSAKYHYYRITLAKGVESAAPLYPTASYVHKLEPQAGGSQQIDLLPGFNIPARRNGSLELQLWTDVSADEYLMMDIEFITSRGTVKTDKFMLGFRSLPS